MSNIAILERNIYALEDSFQQVSVDKGISFKREAEFAMQIIGNNSYALGIALANPDSVRDAVTNISAIGISLNPAKKLAYLVPRDKKICLDLSYMGLIELAVASGSILWAKAELVRAQDGFQLNGFDRPPTHDFSPFSKDRGAIIGVYVVVKTRDGDYLTDTMPIVDVYEIRDRSSAWKAWISKQSKCPWVTDEGEMIKKTVIKRAYKTWPRTDRLDQAIHYLNTDGGQGLDQLHSGEKVDQAPGFDADGAVSSILNAKTLQDLDDHWKAAVEGCRKSKNMVAYERCKKARSATGIALKAQAVEVGS